MISAFARKPALGATEDCDGKGILAEGDPGSAFCAAVDVALERGEYNLIDDKVLQRVFAAAVKLYGAKVEAADNEMAPFELGTVNATEAVVAICAIMRAADLNLLDVGMWLGRQSRPAETS